MENYQIFYSSVHRVARKAGKVAIEGQAKSKLDLLLSEIKKGTELEGVDFRDIDFTGAKIKNANLYNCEFPQINNVTFIGGQNSSYFNNGVTNCKFTNGIHMASSIFSGKISNCDFSGVKIKGYDMYFIDAVLDNCNFSGLTIADKRSVIKFQGDSNTVNNSNFSSIKNLRIDSSSTIFNNCNFSKSIVTKFAYDGNTQVNNPIIDKTKNKSGEMIDFLGESLVQRIMLFEDFVSSKKN